MRRSRTCRSLPHSPLRARLSRFKSYLAMGMFRVALNDPAQNAFKRSGCRYGWV